MSVTSTAAAEGFFPFLMVSALLEKFAMCKKMDEVGGEKASTDILTQVMYNHQKHSIEVCFAKTIMFLNGQCLLEVKHGLKQKTRKHD